MCKKNSTNKCLTKYCGTSSFHNNFSYVIKNMLYKCPEKSRCLKYCTVNIFPFGPSLKLNMQMTSSFETLFFVVSHLSGPITFDFNRVIRSTKLSLVVSIFQYASIKFSNECKTICKNVLLS
jgi:hypothetical protein